MKLLVLSQDIGKSAPGIVYERLLSALTEFCEVDVITCSYSPSISISPSKVTLINYPSIHYRVNKLLFSLFSTDVISFFLRKKIVLNSNYDAILSFCSSGNFFGVIVGRYLHKKYHFPWGCYCVDAVPAPLGWSKNDLFYRSIIRFVRHYFSNIELFASVSDEMLDYELSLFDSTATRKKIVLLPPIQNNRIINFNVNQDSFCYLYTGNTYGKRTAQNVMKAFELLANDIKEVELVFVGTISYEDMQFAKNCPESIRNRIHFYPRTNDLRPFYERSNVLIDIDADLDNDVYLSSKMSSYLVCNRPIICETGDNSPSRRLFKGIPSVLQCNHDVLELKNAMLKCITRFSDFNYQDRDEIINQFNAHKIAKDLCDTVSELIN